MPAVMSESELLRHGLEQGQLGLYYRLKKRADRLSI